MQEQMSSMTPEQMASMGQQAGNMGGQMEARQQYELNASKTLKADANKLFSAGKLQEAQPGPSIWLSELGILIGRRKENRGSHG